MAKILKSHTDYQTIKTHLHHEVLERLDLKKLFDVPTEKAREQVLLVVRNLISSEGLPLASSERERLASEVLDEIFGLGPLELLLQDMSISDILVNRWDQVYIEREGKLERVNLTFKDDQHLLQIIDRIASRVGRRIDESSPMVDARLTDGSRVNAIIAPLSLDGPALSIRRFGKDPLTQEEILANRSVTPAMMELLAAMVRGKLNILISGGTGAGKTTLLNILSAHIPNTERIITVEDAA